MIATPFLRDPLGATERRNIQDRGGFVTRNKFLCATLSGTWPGRSLASRGLNPRSRSTAMGKPTLHDVRLGSLADKPSPTKIQVCPLWSNSEIRRGLFVS